jgi:hypothetical protein
LRRTIRPAPRILAPTHSTVQMSGSEAENSIGLR